MQETLIKKMTKKEKHNKGITLIALVVTIIVLLILAGVAISTLMGNNGIITRSSQAKEAKRAGEVEEQVRLWNLDKQIYTRSGNVGTAPEEMSTLVQKLVDEKMLTSDEKDQILGNTTKGIEATGQVTIGEKTIVFGNPSTAKTLVQAFIDGNIEVGDYISYTPKNTSATVPLYKQDTGWDGTQTYSVDTTMSWKVLGLKNPIDSDPTTNQLIITTESPIMKDMKTGDTAEDYEKDPYLYLQGAEGYVNCVSTLNKICAIYGNSDYAVQTSDGNYARSITADDINNLLGLEVVNNGVYKKTDTERTTNLDQAGALGGSYDYTQDGGYSPTKYMNDVYSTSLTVDNQVNSTAYIYSYTDSSIIASNSELYKTLFLGTEYDATNDVSGKKAYWLASPGVIADPDFADFGPGFVLDGIVGTDGDLFGSGGDWYARRFASRPIVYLKSNINIDQLETSKTGTDKNWNGATNPDLVSGEQLTGSNGYIE